MTTTPAAPPKARGLALALALGRRRLRFAAILALVWGLLLSIGSETGVLSWLLRSALVVGLAVLAFGLCEQWPARLPAWLGRWVWQLLGVVFAVPVAAFIGYSLTSLGSGEPFWHERLRVQGYLVMSFVGILVGPWIALAAMVRQREAFARTQALAFELERSELERQALDARLRLLQAQVQPHFLFNTLANVRALVGSGSAQAAPVLDSLIAYLRAAVPRLHDPEPTIEQELQLVRAYLELMHMRMPDRLVFALHAESAALALPCPAMAVLTLVENAIRHGIDPSEEGGRIDVDVQLREGRCHVRVTDTGLGLREHERERERDTAPEAGTGLATLRERLRLRFGNSARVLLRNQHPRGVCAELEWPTIKPTLAPTPAR